MCFRDHARIDVPTSKGAGFNVLCAERLGQRNRSLDVVRIRLRLDTSTLFFIKRPITVELKSAVRDARSRKRTGRNRVCVGHQWSHRRSLIADCGNSEVDKTRKQIRPVCVSVKIYEAWYKCSSATVDQVH